MKMNAIFLSLILAFMTISPASAQVKRLSDITSGGVFNPATDRVVTVRSGSQDRLTTMAGGNESVGVSLKSLGLPTGGDDCPGIQTAYDTAKAYGVGGVVVWDSVSYVCNTPLTIDPAYTSTVGNGGQLDASAIITSVGLLQSLVGAGNLVLNGATVTGGIARPVVSSPIEIVSNGNDSGINWTITGTDANNAPLTETIAGGNTLVGPFTGVAHGIKYFKTVTQIAGSGSAAGSGVYVNANVPVITIAQASGSDITQAGKNSFYGLKMMGSGKRAGLVAFRFNSANGSVSSRMNINNLELLNFGYGDRYENNAYLVTWNNVAMRGMGTCDLMPTGYSNYGENVDYIGGLCAESDVGQDDEENVDTNTFRNYGRSFDFNGTQLVDNKGIIEAYGCNFENSSPSVPEFVVGANNGTDIRIIGGIYIHDGTSTAAYNAVIGAGQSLMMRDVFINNVASVTHQFSTGGGRPIITGALHYSSPNNFNNLTDITSLADNLMVDGGFENLSGIDNPQLADLVFINSDISPIADRWQGVNLTLSRDNVSPHGGSQYLKVTKNTDAPGSRFQIIAPIKKDEETIGSLYFKVLGTQTGQVFLCPGFYAIGGNNGNGIPIIENYQVIGCQTVTLTGTPGVWIQSTNGSENGNKPGVWATHYGFKFDLDQSTTGSFGVDDIVFNSL